jgi:hypothetical protein
MAGFIVRTTLLAILGIGLLGVTVTQADPLQFFGEDLNPNGTVALTSFPNASAARADFLSKLVSGVGTENFEGFAANTGPPNLALNFPGAGTATITGPVSVRQAPDRASDGQHPTSGTKFIFAASNSDFLVTFSAPVVAFGFYGVDVGDFGGQLRLTVTRVGGQLIGINVPTTIGSNGSTNGSVMFYGLIDEANPFTSVRFDSTVTQTDNFAFDDMTIASASQVNPVPEPTSLTLMALGTVGLGVVSVRARRRKV